jgi:hypothetical protein
MDLEDPTLPLPAEDPTRYLALDLYLLGLV